MSAWLIGILAAIGGALAALLGGVLGRRSKSRADRRFEDIRDIALGAKPLSDDAEAKEALAKEEQRIDQETAKRLEKPAPDKSDFEQLQGELGELERQFEEGRD